MGFGVDFWRGGLRDRGYNVVEERLDLETLAKQRVIPNSHLSKQDDSPRLQDAILFYRPLLVFTDGSSCYAVIVRGVGLEGEARILHLEDRLYRTDLEVLESIRYPGSPEDLVKKYDGEFFPYERVRDEFFERYRDERTEHKRHIRLSGDFKSYREAAGDVEREG